MTFSCNNYYFSWESTTYHTRGCTADITSNIIKTFGWFTEAWTWYNYKGGKGMWGRIV